MNEGSIPAHAGQPQCAAPRADVAGVDPRACGAAEALREIRDNARGRSPRMRGSHDLRLEPNAR